MFLKKLAVAAVLSLVAFGSSISVINTPALASTPIEATAVAVGGETSGAYGCALLVSQEVLCWGQAPVTGIVPGINNAVSIAAGVRHTCAALSTGRVKCWGDNGSGQLGNGSNNNTTTPQTVLGVGGTGQLSNIEEVAASAKRDVTCARSSSGLAYCWGSNGANQLGNPAAGGASNTPVIVQDRATSSNLTNVATLAIGSYATCAVRTNGNAMCWGSAGHNEIGNPSYGGVDTAVNVAGIGGTGILNDAVQIALGDAMGCATRTSGAVACWGYQHLGNGTSGGANYPVAVSGITNAVQVATSEDDGCVLLATGDVKCWGVWHGGTGSGASQQYPSTGSSPTVMPGMTGVRSLGTGGGWPQKYCMVLTNSGVRCFGSNNAGELGVSTGSLMYSNVLVEPVVTFVMGPTTTMSTTTTTTTTLAPVTTTTVRPVTSTTSPALVLNIQAPASSVVTSSSTSTPSTSVARGTNVSSSTTTSVVPDVLAKAPKPASVEPGSGALVVGGRAIETTLTRENNSVVLKAGDYSAVLSGNDVSGAVKSLDNDGNIRLMPGEFIEINVGGFTPKSGVDVWMYSNPYNLGSTVVASDGSVSGRFAIPKTVPDGKHRIVVMVEMPDGKDAIFTIGVMVGAISTTSTMTRVLIAIPIALAVMVGLLLPNRLRRRRNGRVANA